MSENNQKTKTIEIPESLYNRIEKRLPKTDFKTVPEYVSFLIREVLNSLETDDDHKDDFTPEEESEIEERLRHLGYID